MVAISRAKNVRNDWTGTESSFVFRKFKKMIQLVSSNNAFICRSKLINNKPSQLGIPKCSKTENTTNSNEAEHTPHNLHFFLIG